MQLNCLLSGIMSVLNSRPISLHRAQSPHSPLNLITPHNLMFANSRQIKMYNIMQSSHDKRMESDAFVRKQLQYHASRLLNLYTKYLLQSYHKNLNSKPQNLDYKKLALDVPILFNSKPTGTKYSFDNFHFAVVDELRYGRNGSDYPQGDYSTNPS